FQAHSARAAAPAAAFRTSRFCADMAFQKLHQIPGQRLDESISITMYNKYKKIKNEDFLHIGVLTFRPD
ncbi:MAG: hypothetical protein KHZ29_09020, partial [Desulfovibrionaceae bacterium]|nr:hypothetical protein [Desulfovibrionaceae bacterium]